MESNWAGGCPGCGGDSHTGGFWHTEHCPNNPNRPIPDPFPATVVGTVTFAPTLPEPNYGWICPKCGAVYAPFMPYCTRCVGQDNYITRTTGDTKDPEEEK